LTARALGIDFGEKRIGVAATDALGLDAHPLEVLASTPRDTAADRIAAIARERGATVLVVGMPVNMDGTPHDSAPQVRAFARRCVERTGLPLVFVDERLSTVEAERLLRDAGRSRGDRRGLVDMFAAAVILRDWMAAGPGG